MHDIIKKPVITEKAMKLQEQGHYVFEVHPKANKLQIKEAIEELFEVEVKNVRTARIKGKVKTRMTRTGMMVGRKPLKKKAYITLKEGHTIDLVSGAA